MKITFIHPPLDDPTLPYHSLSYLKGQLVRSGFTDVRTRDINIEFVNYCLAAENVEFFAQERQRRLQEMQHCDELSLLQQEEFLDLWTQQSVAPDMLSKAASEMRDPSRFLDYDSYTKNVALLNRYFRSLGALSYPSGIGNFRQLSRSNYSIYNFNDLFNFELARKACYPFVHFFSERLAHDPEFNDTDCFGISIVYDHQMTHAVWLAHALKQRWPEKMLLLGGTAISQYYKYIKDRQQMKRFFTVCDAIVVGEGETAICEIADCQGDFSKKLSIPNTITYNAFRDVVRLPQQIHYENVSTLAPPIYEYPWDLYLSPKRGVNYSPTRGCYWNRCTFCDYGLNTDKPTSPWRERSISQVIADLSAVKASQQIGYVYFAVDVMAPGYLERLSDGMIEADLGLKWSAEVRMEKIFLPERCHKLAKAGCVCLSFGMESGNQRVLDLIDKGTKVNHMKETMRNFSEAGIAVQLMAFKGFPTETAAEMQDTVRFVTENDQYWSTGGLGTFLLTGNAIVARHPERFGIRLEETQNVDIGRAIPFHIESTQGSSSIATEEVDASFNDCANIFPNILGRPWAGGTDTLHSMIYYEKYGKKFFKENCHYPAAGETKQDEPDILNCAVRLAGTIGALPFDMMEMVSHRKTHRDHVQTLRKDLVEPTYGELVKWQETLPRVAQAPSSDGTWIWQGTKCMKLDHEVRDFLQAADGSSKCVNELLCHADETTGAYLLEYLRRLHAGGLIRLEKHQAALQNNMASAVLMEGPGRASAVCA